MKRLLMFVGLAVIAMPAFAAGGTKPKGEIPPECTVGAANTKPAYCANWDEKSGWPKDQPPPGGWVPPPGQQGSQQPPPQQPPPQQPPPTTTTQQPPPTTTTQHCQPGYIYVRYGKRWRCVRQGQNSTGVQCQPGWIYSRQLYRCVPGTIPGTPGTGTAQGPYDQGTPGRRVCGYGKVWSDRLYRCVPFRTGGGTDGGNQGGYGCGPGERWSESRYRCVPRRGGSGGIYIDLGAIGGNIGISNKRRCGHGTYWDGDRCVARRGGDDYGNRGGGGDYGNRGGGGDYGYRGSGGNDYRGRGR